MQHRVTFANCISRQYISVYTKFDEIYLLIMFTYSNSYLSLCLFFPNFQDIMYQIMNSCLVSKKIYQIINK